MTHPRPSPLAPRSSRCIKLTVAYDGTDYVGWQRQKNGPSVQTAIERAWCRFTDETIIATGSGRTDSGVHALGQVVGIPTENRLPPDIILRAMNTYLPHDIVVLQAEEAPADFDPIRHAKCKRYRYVIQDGRILDVMTRRFSWFVPEVLNPEAMRAGAQHLLGRHDFASFQSAGSERATTVRTVFDVSLERGRGVLCENVTFEIAADGFLYNMVRAIVGSLVKIGRGDRTADWMKEVIEARDRTMAGPTAPPQGLLMVKVDYE